MADLEDHRICTSTTARCRPCAASTWRSPTGEFTVLVGPSGCGKRTLLRTIAGLEDADGGTIEIGGEVVNYVPPARPRHRHGVPELRALSLHERVREHRLRPARAQDAEGRDRDHGCERAAEHARHRRTCSTAIRASSPAASASASRSAARSCATRGCSCSTSRCPTSMPSCATRCAARSSACTRSSARP